MFPLLIASPLIGLVKSVASGAGGIASGVTKGLGKAISGTEKEIAERRANASNGDVNTAINTEGAPVDFDEETPEMFGGLDLAKVKSALDDDGPMGPPEPEAPTVYKRMIQVLKTMSATLLRMEATMKMLLAIEYERVKGMVAQSTAENITLAQTPDDDEEEEDEKRGILGAGKDMLGGAWQKAKDSPKWLKMLGLAGLLAAINIWQDKLQNAVAKILEWFTKAYEYFTADDFSWDKLKTDFTTKFLPKVKDFIFGVLDTIWAMIKGAAGEWLFGKKGDRAIQAEAHSGITAKTALADIKTGAGEALSRMKDKDVSITDYRKKVAALNPDTTWDDRQLILDEIKETYHAMFRISKASEGRIQWDTMDRDIRHGDLQGFQNYTVAEILNANPIIDGVISSWGDLEKIELQKMGGITKGMTDDKIKEITKLLTEKTTLARKYANKVSAGADKHELDKIQEQIDANALDLQYSGQIFMPAESLSIDSATSTNGSAQALKDAKKQTTPSGAIPPFISNVSSDNNSVNIKNEGDVVVLNAKNDYATNALLNEALGFSAKTGVLSI